MFEQSGISQDDELAKLRLENVVSSANEIRNARMKISYDLASEKCGALCFYSGFVDMGKRSRRVEGARC